MKPIVLVAGLFLALPAVGAADDRDKSGHTTIAIEAEHFGRQRRANVRRWFVYSEESQPSITPDGDPPHHETASGGAYVEVLPDTRRTHSDRLQNGVNFSGDPGRVAVLDYLIDFPAAGRYYVWVRAYSTGSEDNGIHVGLDDRWPPSGARMQWCKGKKKWWWESRQRTEQEHCGVENAIYLDVRRPGRHMVSFSMREDGFEFDKFLLTTDRDFERPKGAGPEALEPENSSRRRR